MSIQTQFIQAYDELADAIFRHCYFRVFQREKARDLMQETFKRAWQYMAEGKKVDNLRAFLYRVANNLIIDDSRKKKEYSLEEMQETDIDILEQGQGQSKGIDIKIEVRTRLHDTIDGRMALEALERIDQPYRDAVLMRFVDDLTPREIAEITGESPNVISVRIHRGIAMLRQVLQHQHSQNDAVVPNATEAKQTV